MLYPQNEFFKQKGEKVVECPQKNGQSYGKNHNKSRKPDSFLPGRPVDMAPFLPCFLKKCLYASEHGLPKDTRK
jgi:hypothetical protein